MGVLHVADADAGLRRRAVRGDIRSRLGIRDAVRAFFSGIGFIAGTPRLWIYAAVPAVVTVALGGIAVVLGVHEAERLALSVAGKDGSLLNRLGADVLTMLLCALFIVLGLLLALKLAQPLSGFALNEIVRARAESLTGRRSPPASLLAGVLTEVCVALLSLIVGTPVLAALWLVTALFPPVAVVTTPLYFVVTGCLLAWDFFDYPLAIRGVGLSVRLRWLRSHWLGWMTFGALWALVVSFFPPMILLILPMAIAGATQMVVVGGSA